MNIRYAKFAGFSRAMPDVLTFVTPVFFDEEEGYLIQKSTDGRVSEFQKTFVGVEFEKIEENIISMKNDYELFGFEYAQDCLILGYKEQLIGILKEFESTKKGYDFTKAAIKKFISSAHYGDHGFFISPHLFHIRKTPYSNKWNTEIIHGSLPFFLNQTEKSELFSAPYLNPVVKVIGVGGGGGNAVRHMIDRKIEGIEFIYANTDSLALKDIDSRAVLQLGNSMTKGLGAGTNPEVGRQAAMEDREQIAEILRGADMVFIAAGMGGGTGTGAAPVVAEVARDLGILTVAVVTKPFPFEGRKRMVIAEAGLKELGERVDSLITIPNEKLLSVLGKSTSLLDAFTAANDVLLGAVQGIVDLIIRPGMINVDFADVRTVMSEMGMTMMGTGRSTGEHRAREAAEAAISSPLLEDVDLQSARGILVSITTDIDLSLGEYSEVSNIIEEFASGDATIVVGTAIDPKLANELRVTVFTTGLNIAAKDSASIKEKIPAPTKIIDNTRRPAADYALAQLRANAHSAGAAALAAPLGEKELEYLDIPAFLRRQSDD